jgi:hypothetical protein
MSLAKCFLPRTNAFQDPYLFRTGDCCCDPAVYCVRGHTRCCQTINGPAQVPVVALSASRRVV